MVAKGGLGRGLGALIGDATAETGTNVDFMELPLNKINPNPNQPRLDFDEEKIKELESSIRKDGLLQPILVRPEGDGYQIVAGERRWQACKRLEKETIPAKILIVNDVEAQQIALVENLQRDNLNAIEEARGYKRLLELSGGLQKDLAEAVSKSQVTISNALRLLDLPEEVQEMMLSGSISAGHGRAILSLPDEDARIRLAKKIVAENLTVREAENIARLYGSQGFERSKRMPTPRAFGIAARKLRKILGTGVRVKTVRGKNKVEIEFADEEDLERILGVIEDGPRPAASINANKVIY
ncbi:MAG: ParB/RepB/Spo0J family partition protein [Coriobacteriales bacterium]|nr:ParB/RepB/Spo0J family partition protein [Coriobacteriales bacterium]